MDTVLQAGDFLIVFVLTILAVLLVTRFPR